MWQYGGVGGEEALLCYMAAPKRDESDPVPTLQEPPPPHPHMVREEIMTKDML